MTRYKKSYLDTLTNNNSLPNVSLSQSVSLPNDVSLSSSPDVSYIEELNNIKSLLNNIVIFKEEDIKAFWSMLMADSRVSTKDRLAASKLLAQSLGMMDTGKAVASIGGAVYKWKTPTIEAEVVPAEKTMQGKNGKCNSLDDKQEIMQ